jgi:hypothetical protein
MAGTFVAIALELLLRLSDLHIDLDHCKGEFTIV